MPTLSTHPALISVSFHSEEVVVHIHKSNANLVALLAVNCLDHHVARDPSTVAIIWEKYELGKQEEISYKYVQLYCCVHAHTTEQNGVAYFFKAPYETTKL